MLQDYFSKLGEVYFIISIRNPYSCRWRGYNPESPDWIECAKYQKYNLENLNNTILISYEECCNNLKKVISKITNKIPELGTIFNNSHPKLMLETERGNLIHSNKVNRILDKEKKNKILKKNIDLIKYFGYNIID